MTERIRALGVLGMLSAVFAALLVAPGGAAQAAERAYFRIVDHPRVEKFVTQSSPSAPWLLKTRIDALWNPRHTGEVEISVQIVRKSGKRWVAAGPPATRSESDGNLTVFAEGVAQPGGPYEYAAQWNARAKGARPGVGDWSRPNERGPAIQFTTPGGRITLPGPIPTLHAPTPSGCVQKVFPGTHVNDRKQAVATAYSGCPNDQFTTAISQEYVAQRCITAGLAKCLTGWKTIDSDVRVVRGPLPRTTYVEVTHDVLYIGPWRYRVIVRPVYRQRAIPPRTEINIKAPDIQAQYILRGHGDGVI